MIVRTILLASLMLAAFATPAFAADDPSALLGRFMQAWSTGDAKGIAMLFAADADFVNPDGYKASGRDAIEMFYAGAFAHGYAGSKGVGEVVATRFVAPDFVLIDGRWSIDGAKTESGAPRSVQRGILTALVRRERDGWRIVALRETNSATDFHTLAAKP
jgi:uncharacterized protein (TIGR02246 family)